MKVLLAENTSGYERALATINEKAAILQAGLSAYAALGIAAVPTTADLYDLWHAPKTFLGRMLTGGQPVTFNNGAFALDPSQVYDTVQKPANTPAFFAALGALRGPGAPGEWNYIGVDTNEFELNGGTVQVKAATQARVLESFRYYATNQRQKNEWDNLQIIATALQAIRQNGNFGQVFEPLPYLEKVLFNRGYFDKGNSVGIDNGAFAMQCAMRLQD